MSADERQSVDQAIVAHSLIAAHGDRVQELARLYDSFERAMAQSGAADREARDVHHRLSARIAEWMTTDLEAERRDIIPLPADEREAMQREIARAIPRAEREADGLPASAPEHVVVRLLREFHASLPATLPRASLVRFRRSAARLKRFEELDAPAFCLGNEARILVVALESATAPTALRDVAFDPSDRFERTFIWGLEACAILHPGAAGAVDLGLGTSAAVAALLGGSGEDFHDLNERWVQSAAPSHPFARYPYIPHGRFCAVSSTSPVRCDLESTGPIGWAAGDDVARLARDLCAIADQKPAFAAELRAVGGRLDSVAQRGEAVIGWVEYLPFESDGNRQWLVAGDMEI
jgi:hypothetical protein